MQNNKVKNKRVEKILTALNKVNSHTSKVIKYGSLISLIMLTIGTVMIIYNSGNNFDPYFGFLAKSVISTSFTILAETIIGGLLLDYVFNKK